RDLLRARLARMQQQVGIARALEADDVPTRHIGVGSKVTFRHVDSANCVEMVFLGPFETDVERHIYNYKAPLAQALMGLVVGDRAELTAVEPPGLYEVLAISNELAPT
ncbi:MAG: GreA/GreB family elongation factor, partial [Planctomycetota bacterium]